MRGKPNPDEWRRLDLNIEYAAGQAYQRFLWLIDYDPYVSMLSERTINALGNLIFSDAVLGDSSIHEAYWSKPAVAMGVYEALSNSPLTLLLTSDFKNHIVSLVQTAVFAGKE